MSAKSLFLFFDPTLLKDKRHYSWIVALVALSTYLNTIQNGFVLDDDVVYLKNKFVQEGISGIPAIFSHGFLYGFNQKNDQSYRPIVLSNFAIEHQFFSNDPKIHHFFNALFYGIICLLLYRFLSLIIPEKNRWLIIWIALIYAIHPVHTEVVANIKGRDELLHAIFYLLTLIHVLNWLKTDKNKNLYLGLFFCFLTCLTKEMGITLLATIPLTIYLVRDFKMKDLAMKVAFFSLPIILYFLIRNLVLDTIAFEEKMTIINNGIAAAQNYGDQLATTLFIFFNYLKLLFFPHPLAWDYSFPHFQVQELSSPLILMLGIILLLIIVFSLREFFLKRNIIAFGILFFLTCFSIVSNFFVLIGATLGERFLFLPSIGFAISFVIGLWWVFEKLIPRPLRKKSFALFLSCLIILGFIKTLDRNSEWESNESLFKAGVAATPNNSRAVSAYASTFRAEAEMSNNVQQRKTGFISAIKLYKESIALFNESSDVHYNLGVSYMGIQQNELAKQSFHTCLKIDPNHLQALNNIGVIYFQSKNFIEAENYFKSCLRINAEFQNALANLGAVYHNLGKIEKAKIYYDEALRINPNDANTRQNRNRIQ